mmetsp:Transcript_45157/g.67065  ORF Transcript_45157/g.67065 Transcript_45157/m.67065 type:complete len:200 (-) Transcript_45157:106-705(-)
MSDGHILEHDFKFRCSLFEFTRNICRYFLTLRQEFIGVVTSHDGLGTLVHQTWEDAFVVIQTKEAINPDQGARVRLVQDTNGNSNHLKILRTRQRLQVHRPGSNIKNNWTFKPGNVEIESFTVHLTFHACNTVKHYSTMTTIDSVDRIVGSIAKSESCYGRTNGTPRSLSDTTTAAAAATTTHVGHLLRHALKRLSELL